MLKEDQDMDFVRLNCYKKPFNKKSYLKTIHNFCFLLYNLLLGFIRPTYHINCCFNLGLTGLSDQMFVESLFGTISIDFFVQAFFYTGNIKFIQNKLHKYL